MILSNMDMEFLKGISDCNASDRDVLSDRRSGHGV